MKRFRPTHEIWIKAGRECGALRGEALIGLVYRADDGATRELLAATPRPETTVEYRPIRPEQTEVKS